MISYDIISQPRPRLPPRPRPCDAMEDLKLFSGTLPWKNDLQKTPKIQKRTARKFCTFSLLNHYKIFFLEPFSTIFYFYVLYVYGCYGPTGRRSNPPLPPPYPIHYPPRVPQWEGEGEGSRIDLRIPHADTSADLCVNSGEPMCNFFCFRNEGLVAFSGK